jgi:hypothetical protein
VRPPLTERERPCSGAVPGAPRAAVAVAVAIDFRGPRTMGGRAISYQCENTLGKSRKVVPPMRSSDTLAPLILYRINGVSRQLLARIRCGVDPAVVPAPPSPPPAPRRPGPPPRRPLIQTENTRIRSLE